MSHTEYMQYLGYSTEKEAFDKMTDDEIFVYFDKLSETFTNDELQAKMDKEMNVGTGENITENGFTASEEEMALAEKNAHLWQ